MQIKRLFIVLALGWVPLLALLMILSPAQAAGTTRYVATTGKDIIGTEPPYIINNCTAIPCRTVQHAVNRADPGDTILVATGVYTGVQARDGMTQVVYIAKSVTIRGGYTTTNWNESFPLTQPTTLDAQGLGRVVVITGSVAPTLDGLVIARGNAAGQVAECPYIHGRASGCGGGIFIYAAGPLIVNNIITNNVASAAAITGVTGYGGGLYLKNAHGAVIRGNVIISNTAHLTGFGDGGGLHLDHSNAQVRSNQVLNNYASLRTTHCWGGGISAYYGAPTVEGNILRGNWVNPSGRNYSGAAIYLWSDSGTYSGNQIADNHGQSAIFLSRGQPRLESNQVISNATTIGVELFNGPGAATLVNNIVARSGTQVIRAEGQSGQALTATLIHNTLVGPGGGSGIYVAGYTSLFVTNTIAVSATWGITNTTPASATVSADHNLFWANTYPGIQGTNPVNGDPHLVNPAAGDYHIGAGSAAIDVGVLTAVTTDIDGDPRPLGLPDMGADEYVVAHIWLPLVLRQSP